LKEQFAMVNVTPLSQMDTRWKDNKLGFSSMTIGNYGCLMTSMTMVANYYGFNETPATVNDKMKAVKGFQEALIIPGAFPAALPGLIYRNFINCENSPAPMTEIDAYLAQGKPVIIEVDYAPNPGLQNHWIVLTEKRGNDYLLRDPWPFPVVTTDVTLLTSRYKFGGSPAQIIKGVVFLEGRNAPVQKPTVTLDKGVRASFPVYATADGLALRSDTVVADYTLVKRVPLGGKLTILEADATAKPKIGVLNQWIAVLDPTDNTQGMTAAWYVSLTPPGATTIPPAAPQPTNKPLNLIVKTIDEGVALRSKPEISDAALAKRVPVNTELVCTEPFDAALAKVGVVYQWLQVKDVANCAYYVAAWYVKAVNGQAALGAKDQGTVSFAVETGEPEPLIARAGVEGLALRTLPLIMQDTLIKRLPIDGELIVLEPPAAAEAKLGKMGEWLHVRDVEGQEGYVAAWYAVKRPDLAITENKPVLG
jgi:hypothetical protein